MKTKMLLSAAALLSSAAACTCWDDDTCDGPESWCKSILNVMRQSGEFHYTYSGVPMCMKGPIGYLVLMNDDADMTPYLCGDILTWYKNDSCLCSWDDKSMQKVYCYTAYEYDDCDPSEAVFNPQTATPSALVDTSTLDTIQTAAASLAATVAPFFTGNL